VVYQSIVGTPVLTPQWALGWHQCKWGYATLDEVKEVVHNYTLNNLPLDTQWSDIDYLDRYRDFTYDPVNYAGLGDFVKYLHSENLHYIPIIDAGIAQRPDVGYGPYDDGVADDIFVKTDANETFTGQVWPDDAAYPDFFHPKTTPYWHKWLSAFHDQVEFDGVWEDMNEASNFCDGVCYKNQEAMSPVKNMLPYIPTGRNLETKSIALDARHANGYTELDVHSMFGTTEVKSTHEWFQAQKQRTMIIERSAYAGTGKFASRWLGDNFATEEYMGYSVTGVMMHNILGIPLVGSDICGFILNTTPELCARWYVVGAFYPFSRNHNNYGNAPQEPWVFKNEQYTALVSYFDIIQMAMRTKLHMIRYYYTQLSGLSAAGGAFYKPLFFEFPNDSNALIAPQEYNIMLGKDLKLSINSNKLGQDTTDFYFPAGQWCDVWNKEGAAGCFISPSTGEFKTLPTKAYDFYLHLREGSLVPMQNGTELAKTMNVSSTHDLQQHPVELHLLPLCDIPSGTCIATGSYYNDDGVVFDTETNSNMYDLVFTLDVTTQAATLKVNHVANATSMENNKVNANDELGAVEIYSATQLTLVDNTYAVSATMLDGTTVTDMADAAYDSMKDRIIWTHDSSKPTVNLPQVDFITFTKNT
jgi:alpha-glucosidase (family GH31 glycosyl hydrolase)